jgi:hypothetical protein
MAKSQKVFNIGDLVRWKALVKSPKPTGGVRNVEALGIIRKLIGRDSLELKVVSTNNDCADYLNALKELGVWDRLPVHVAECEVMA